MKIQVSSLALLAAGVLLVGAGCAQPDESSSLDEGFQSKPAEENTATETPSISEPTPEPPPVQVPQTNDLTLSAEALGNGEVKFTWTAPEGLTEANRFILVQGKDENPEHTGKNNWFRQYHTNRETIWRGLTAGTAHFRICLTENNQKDVCTKYSNDVMVEVR